MEWLSEEEDEPDQGRPSGARSSTCPEDARPTKDTKRMEAKRGPTTRSWSSGEYKNDDKGVEGDKGRDKGTTKGSEKGQTLMKGHDGGNDDTEVLRDKDRVKGACEVDSANQGSPSKKGVSKSFAKKTDKGTIKNFLKK